MKAFLRLLYRGWGTHGGRGDDPGGRGVPRENRVKGLFYRYKIK